MIDVAFITTASAFSSSGETARSLLAITHQDGLVLHAAVAIVAPKTAAAVGPPVAVNNCLLVWQILGEVFSNSLWDHRQKPSASARTSLPSGAGGNGLVTEATDSPSDGASAAT